MMVEIVVWLESQICTR